MAPGAPHPPGLPFFICNTGVERPGPASLPRLRGPPRCLKPRGEAQRGGGGEPGGRGEDPEGRASSLPFQEAPRCPCLAGPVWRSTGPRAPQLCHRASDSWGFSCRVPEGSARDQAQWSGGGWSWVGRTPAGGPWAQREGEDPSGGQLGQVQGRDWEGKACGGGVEGRRGAPGQGRWGCSTGQGSCGNGGRGMTQPGSSRGRGWGIRSPLPGPPPPSQPPWLLPWSGWRWPWPWDQEVWLDDAPPGWHWAALRGSPHTSGPRCAPL